MARCDKCGFPLPGEASFCPNCGATVKKKIEVHVSPMKAIINFLKIGLLGAFLSISILLFSPSVDLYFIPSFVSSLIVVYLSRTRKIENAIGISMTVYLLTNAMVAGINLGVLYIDNQPLASLYGDYVPTLLDVIMYVASPITPFIAAYLGVRFAPKTKEEPSSITYRRREAGPGGVIYSLERKLKMRIPTRLIRFKYNLVRSLTIN